MIIAVDGPAASGKGTLALGLARHYGLPHLDTGLLYRAVGLGRARRGRTRPTSRRAPSPRRRRSIRRISTDLDALTSAEAGDAGQQGRRDRRGARRRCGSISAISPTSRAARCSTAATSAP